MKGFRRKVYSAVIVNILMITSLCACGKKEEIVDNKSYIVVCSSFEEQKAMPLLKEFSERYGYSMKYIYHSDEEIERLYTEQSETVKDWDIVLGGCTELYEDMEEQFSYYEGEQKQFFQEEYRLRDKNWTPVCAQPIVLVYNMNMITQKEIPQSLMSLYEEGRRGKIAFVDPLSSNINADVLLLMKEATMLHKDKTKELKDNVGPIFMNRFSDVNAAVLQGQFAIGLTTETDAITLHEEEENIKYVYPVDGTLLLVNGVAITKNCGRQQEARRFVDFITGKDAQKLMAEVMHYRSVRTDVGTTNVKALDQIKILGYENQINEEKRKEILMKWRE